MKFKTYKVTIVLEKRPPHPQETKTVKFLGSFCITFSYLLRFLQKKLPGVFCVSVSL